jgi:SRSO17 transposase
MLEIPVDFESLRSFVRPMLMEIETRQGRALGAEYVAGLVGPSERKTAEPMVRASRGGPAPAKERRVQESLAESNWNPRRFTLRGAEQLMQGRGEFTAYTLEDTSLLKKGEHSVGVSPQYAGCTGHVENCQTIVTAGVASEHVSALIAAQLYLPQSWCSAESAERRRRTRVPTTIRFKTKHEIGLDLVRDVREWGLPKLPWLCDSAYGDSVEMRAALAAAGETYVAGASLGLSMWPIETRFEEQAKPAKQGRPPTRLRADERPTTVTELALGLPRDAWKDVLWREGSRGPQRSRFAAVRVRPARGLQRNNANNTIRPEDLQPEQWLLIHWPVGKPAPTKSWLSNLPPDTDIVELVGLARLRWRIERDHEETKQLFGLAHYEGRSWPGLHHHLAFVIVASQFVARQRLCGAHEVSAAPAAFPPSAHRATHEATRVVDVCHCCGAPRPDHRRNVHPLPRVPTRSRRTSRTTTVSNTLP